MHSVWLELEPRTFQSWPKCSSLVIELSRDPSIWSRSWNRKQNTCHTSQRVHLLHRSRNRKQNTCHTSQRVHLLQTPDQSCLLLTRKLFYVFSAKYQYYWLSGYFIWMTLLGAFARSGFGFWNTVSGAFSVFLLKSGPENITNHVPRLRLKVNSITRTEFCAWK